MSLEGLGGVVAVLASPACIQQTALEVESVVVEESRNAGVELRKCEVIRDPLVGLVVKWEAVGDGDALAQRLAQFTFRSEQV